MKQQKVIVVSSINTPPQGEVDESLAALGSEWKIVSANTSVAVFGVDPDSTQMPPLHHAVYVTTIVVEKTGLGKARS